LLPVTARLSGKFYERFGDDIANELVEWFNAVDSTYQTQLKEINDLDVCILDRDSYPVDRRDAGSFRYFPPRLVRGALSLLPPG
jgi:hypothetical protein